MKVEGKKIQMKKILFCLIVMGLATSCSGIRKSGDMFTAHAEAVNILGFHIPESDYPKAKSLVPAGATVHTVRSNPNDWTSVLGGLNNILGISYTEISGKK